MIDLTIPQGHAGKFRRDWGQQNMVGIQSPMSPAMVTNGFAKRQVGLKISNFVCNAVFPQQLTIPRQYATTRVGCWIYKILEGRTIAGIKENGVRVVVQENAQQARFVMSPLFASKPDALSWAYTNMGAEAL